MEGLWQVLVCYFLVNLDYMLIMFHQIAVFSKKALFYCVFIIWLEFWATLLDTAPSVSWRYFYFWSLYMSFRDTSPNVNKIDDREGFVYMSMCLWQKAWIGLNTKKCVHENLGPLDASFRAEKMGVRTFISSLVSDLLWVSSDTVLPVRNRRGSSD